MHRLACAEMTRRILVWAGVLQSPNAAAPVLWLATGRRPLACPARPLHGALLVLGDHLRAPGCPSDAWAPSGVCSSGWLWRLADVKCCACAQMIWLRDFLISTLYFNPKKQLEYTLGWQASTL